jgi:hypothetical protein
MPSRIRKTDRSISRLVLSGAVALAGAAMPLSVAAASLGWTASPASAQLDREDPTVIMMKRQTLARMMKPVTVELEGQRLEDVVQFIRDITQADITPLWIDDRNIEGLDKDTPITASVKKATALQLLEIVLDKAASATGAYEEATWQFTKYGSFEFGPKSRLNRRKMVELYDINDLLITIPDYGNQAPQFDLNTVFQQAGQQGGGGGGQSPFQIQQQQQQDVDRDAMVQDIIDLLVTTIEPDQWVDNGGEGATIREFRGNLFINAPDYIHRQINGYQWWPSRAQKVSYVDKRRYVTLDGGFDFSDIGLANTLDVEAAP